MTKGYRGPGLVFLSNNVLVTSFNAKFCFLFVSLSAYIASLPFTKYIYIASILASLKVNYLIIFLKKCMYILKNQYISVRI